MDRIEMYRGQLALNHFLIDLGLEGELIRKVQDMFYNYLYAMSFYDEDVIGIMGDNLYHVCSEEPKMEKDLIDSIYEEIKAVIV